MRKLNIVKNIAIAVLVVMVYSSSVVNTVPEVTKAVAVVCLFWVVLVSLIDIDRRFLRRKRRELQKENAPRSGNSK